MRFKHITLSNCRFLLPALLGTQTIRGLDCYLEEIDNSKEYKGLIGKLEQCNKITHSKNPRGRFLISGIEVSFYKDYQRMVHQWQVLDHSISPEGAPAGYDGKTNAIFSLIAGDGTRWTFQMPLQYLLKGWGNANDGHQCYMHCIKLSGIKDMSEEAITNEQETIEKCYLGITKRNWLKRLEEHLSEVRQGDNKLFHRAWREATNGKDIVYRSNLIWVNQSYKEAMEWEERMVDKHTLSPKGLNMIPGGFEGLRHLYKHRITNRMDISLAERDRAIAEYVRQHPRKGMPNPFMTELWKDDEHYLKVIGSRKKTLTPDQVRRIRELDRSGCSVAKITRRVGALNEKQVQDVLANRTYTRIH